MKMVIVLQARMTSTRLPGKVLADIGGSPMLAQQIRRMKRCRFADEIVAATTTNAKDDPVVELARKEGVRYFRGSEFDVLGRFVSAAAECRADVVVRTTADYPLIDPEVADRVVGALVSAPAESDYSANIIERTYPRGLDVEAFFTDVLLRVDRMVGDPRMREHVTPFIYRDRPDLFRIGSVRDARDNSDLSWTLDTQEDLERVRRIYEDLGLAESFRPYPEILAAVRGKG